MQRDTAGQGKGPRRLVRLTNAISFAAMDDASQNAFPAVSAHPIHVPLSGQDTAKAIPS